jgi:hypothetical protein
MDGIPCRVMGGSPPGSGEDRDQDDDGQWYAEKKQQK